MANEIGTKPAPALLHLKRNRIFINNAAWAVMPRARRYDIAYKLDEHNPRQARWVKLIPAEDGYHGAVVSFVRSGRFIEVPRFGALNRMAARDAYFALSDDGKFYAV